VRTLARERLGYCKTDSARPACNDRDTTSKHTGVLFPGSL
jgi:hypothetical protein